jgi:choline dehydrogenase-like flavoprotein
MNATNDTDRVYDAIIVGSGAGGAAAAYRLVQAGLEVLLLEKGRELPRDATTLDVQTVVHEGRFKSHEPWLDGAGHKLVPEEYFNVGGKTRWYGAALLRYSAGEFSADEPHQCRAWPITAVDLRPYYEQAERLLGVRRFEREPGLRRIAKRITSAPSAWQAEPLPMGLADGILGNEIEARHFDGFASPAGLKGDAQASFLDRVRHAPNLTVHTGDAVTELVPALGQPARLVGVRTASGIEHRGRHVLLAAGALHTPRLVQRYFADQHLAGVLPCARNVGRNLKLHLLTAVVGLGVARQDDLLRKTTLFTHPRLPHSSVQPLGFDGELIAGLIPRLVPRPIARLLGAHAYGFFLQTEDGSHPDNRVEWAGERGAPLLDYDARRVAPALAEHAALVSRFRSALARAGLLAFSQRIGLAGTAHACGTMIAGHDPANSVVDADGRVHGMDGLYVVDGSVLPRSSRVNPSLSIYGWSLRVADRLALANRGHGQPDSRTGVEALRA